MSKTGHAAAHRAAAFAIVLLAACAAEPQDPLVSVPSIRFVTEELPPGEAGRPYEATLLLACVGGAPPPDRFEIAEGALPRGLVLSRADGEAAARVHGTPREPGAHAFTVKAIATVEAQADLATTRAFRIEVGEGAIAVLTPTAEEGTTDPAVPAFPALIPFVNPANPEAFHSFAFLLGGGSGHTVARVLAPREFELSVFDAHGGSLRADAPEDDFSDGGVFTLQAGPKKVQVGGFPSPRGPVMEDLDGDGTQETPFLAPLPKWFQGEDVPRSARRDLGDGMGHGEGDGTLGSPEPLRFADYFDEAFETAAKYPFAADQYVNAFFVPYREGEDTTPLMYRLIVEAIDTKGTVDRLDDVIARKAFVARVSIPDIAIDTVLLPSGQAGTLYAAQVSLSGGVPPLYADLTWVDATDDLAPTAGGELTKEMLGIEIDPRTWRFLGAPRASGGVDLTVRAWAQVMNPKQAGEGFVPTGTPGERDGTLDPDGAEGPAEARAGRHRTFRADFAPPVPPSVGNASLAPGVDGHAYPGDRVVGVGGAPLLVPYPVGFFDGAPDAVYPAASAQRTYEWMATYVRDASYPAQTVAPGLPAALDLVRGAGLATNGMITGVTLDRGFHAVRFMGKDFYAGPASAPDLALHRGRFEKALALSVSPDRALYLRGVGAGEAAGGEPTGLLEPAAQTGEPHMAPLMLAAGLFSVEMGRAPGLSASLPVRLDTLPVMLSNGGSDAGNRMSIPQVRGFWPGESGKEARWDATGHQAWKHVQQELAWLQAPDADRTRVLLWADATTTKTFSNKAWSQRYQQLDPTKRRGVLVTKPLTGDWFVPAILDGTVPDHGTLFGAEAVVSASSVAGAGSRHAYGDRFYTKLYFYAVRDSAHDREAHLHGGSAWLSSYASASDTAAGYYMQSLGRTATSVAMSHDGLWCATALVGGSDVQKILLWRNDRTPLPAAMLSRPHVTALDGKDRDGTVLPGTACILRVGGQQAGSALLSKSQRHLLPDSLCFVENGLLFLNETQFDRVFGVSLVDGHLSSVDLNKARSGVNGAGAGPVVSAATGQFVPDQDYLRGQGGAQGFGAQFAFAGDLPDPGEEGPDRIAFVAGSNAFLAPLTDLEGYPRQGYALHANRGKALLFLELDTANGGLDLGTSTLKDLTGGDARIHGDLLTPGRPGEELDYLALSDDGRYAAVVKDIQMEDHMQSSAFGYRATFHTAIGTRDESGDGWTASHDLVLVSTEGVDMDGGSGGTQHVLYLGTGSLAATDPANLPSYAAGRAHLNASFRRINGLAFAPDGSTLLLNYAGHDGFNPLYHGGTGTGAPHNPEQLGTHGGSGTQSSLSLTFRTPSGNAIDFASGACLSNNLAGLAGAGATEAPYGQSATAHCFWATFRSPNGRFLYFVGDGIDASLSFTSANRNFMVGFNIGAETVGGRAPFTPFVPHPSTVGFEQFDANAWCYESRFAASPGTSILCVVASDASAGAGSATDLEVYAMDADLGTDLVALTAAVTGGTANAINHLYLSADGLVLAGQIARTAVGTSGGRAHLNGVSDLFVVANVRDAVLGATPDAFVLSKERSHGASVAFVGEGAGAGGKALVYSAGTAAASNASWTGRTLYVAPLASGAVPTLLDGAPSHYAVLAAGRKEDDDPASAE